MIEIPLSKQRKRVSYQTLSTNRTLSTYFLNIREAIVCQVLHAQNDADHLIVDTAVVAAAESGSPIVIIGEDTDLLVLLCSNDTASVKNMYFMSGSKSGTKKNKIWKIDNTRTVLGEEVCKCLPFIHDFLDVTQHHIYTVLEKCTFEKMYQR